MNSRKGFNDLRDSAAGPFSSTDNIYIYIRSIHIYTSYSLFKVVGGTRLHHFVTMPFTMKLSSNSRPVDPDRVGGMATALVKKRMDGGSNRTAPHRYVRGLGTSALCCSFDHSFLISFWFSASIFQGCIGDVLNEY